jgi:hypothetical protein
MEKNKSKTLTPHRVTMTIGAASAVVAVIEFHPSILREILRLLEVAIHLAFARS